MFLFKTLTGKGNKDKMLYVWYNLYGSQSVFLVAFDIQYNVFHHKLLDTFRI